MTTPDPFDELLSKPWPLPEPMDADTYWREATETAQSEAAYEQLTAQARPNNAPNYPKD